VERLGELKARNQLLGDTPLVKDDEREKKTNSKGRTERLHNERVDAVPWFREKTKKKSREDQKNLSSQKKKRTWGNEKRKRMP